MRSHVETPDLHRVTQRPPRVRVMNGDNDDHENREMVTRIPLEVTTASKEHCPGCSIEINHNDANIQKYARNATDIYKARNEIPRDAALERIFDVHRQVINGLRYDFKIIFSYSLGDSTIKNMATCEVEVLLHHTRRTPLVNAKPCKIPRSVPVSGGTGDEEI
ncbi:hypothetical protein L9F63_017866 [Diploptera punctata]|uniref:Cystatin domain-containing protein n=1 Tax=Diploptera punctata TaxID=6984 RepID=A0AAD7ZY09_DIPPU|nr:hypothetical protein L9F63_017866 [Diploptera punctata]